MATFFNTSEGKGFRDEVPWHNTYNKDSNNLDNETIIKKIVICSTGLLLIGQDFKDFLYEGKRITEQIKEALFYYVEHPNDSLPLIMQCSGNRQSNIGILYEYEGEGVWLKDPKGFIFDLPDDRLDSPPSSNPFLPTNTSATVKKEKRGTAGGRKSK